MDFPTVVSAAGLVNNAISLLKNARELAKDTSDTELKEKIGDAYDALIDLKDRVLSLDEENRSLKLRLESKDAYVGPVSPFGYYYQASNEKREHPLCPQCFQSEPSKVGFFGDAEDWNHGIKRTCHLCGHHVFEKPMDLSPRRRTVSPGYNPYS